MIGPTNSLLLGQHRRDSQNALLVNAARKQWANGIPIFFVLLENLLFNKKELFKKMDCQVISHSMMTIFKKSINVKLEIQADIAD